MTPGLPSSVVPTIPIKRPNYFRLYWDGLFILTPWLLFRYSDYGLDLVSYTYWKGFEIAWSSDPNPAPGVSRFRRSFKMVVDSLTIESLQR